MDFASFSESIDHNELPDTLDSVLTALWKAARGDWEEAHNLVQDAPGAEAAWVHAYLHRVEGDAFNAGYWYRRAGRPTASGDFENEWTQIVKELLARRP